MVTFDGVYLRAIGLEAGRDVVVVQALRVELVFERGAPSAVAEPDAFERWNFVVAGPAPGLEGEVGVGAYGDGKYLVPRRVIGGDGEPVCHSCTMSSVRKEGLSWAHFPAVCAIRAWCLAELGSSRSRGTASGQFVWANPGGQI
jgi:hypothetical protein